MANDIDTRSTDFNFLGSLDTVGGANSLPGPKSPYTQQEIKYVAELISNHGRCRQAARAAGYTFASSTTSYRWIRSTREESTKPHLWDLYQQQMQLVSGKLALTVERVMDEYSFIGFYDPGDLFDEYNRVKDFHDLPENVRRSISKFKITVNAKGDVVTDITMMDKLRALDSMSKIMGMLKDNVTVEHTFTKLLNSLSAADEPLALSTSQYDEIEDIETEIEDVN